MQQRLALAAHNEHECLQNLEKIEAKFEKEREAAQNDAKWHHLVAQNNAFKDKVPLLPIPSHTVCVMLSANWQDPCQYACNTAINVFLLCLSTI